MIFFRLWLVVATLSLIAVHAQAASLLFTGSSGSLNASAMFKVTPGDGNGTIQVTLTNTADSWPHPQLVPANLLTAVYFNLVGGAVVTPLSAVVPLGQDEQGVRQGLLPPNSDTPYGSDDVGRYWQYATGLQHAALQGAHSGISSTGLGIFGTANFCASGCEELDGLPYGIVPASYNRGEGNGGIEGIPVIRYSAVFTLQGYVPESTTVENVWFQYGTSLSEPRFAGFGGTASGGEVPEPATTLMIGCGLLAFGAALRKRMRRSA